MQSPPSSDLPPLSPVLVPLSTEEKPARQRLHVKRTYYRKLNLLQTLRDQVHELETEYDQLRAQQHLHEALADAPAFYSALEEDAQNRYSQLSKLKARAIILRSIDPDLLVLQENPPGVREQWLDCYIWVTFERVGEHGHHCLFDFGGEVRCTPVINSDAWMLELLFIVLRWEHHVVGPVFSLGSVHRV
ncbi:hypothetical protein Poli38472_013374 [Pythium oligandrum]|uniref:Uncharacterized protein n=1 Tax=Pythium oligandrum TaxID=41045 RepID=A0A8K1FC37_PYTOL|nr:hypothetical protein Poli38472_013374 [Pythium oligandrum]|eukprot:TMW57900.1 hypothetical protein Poli38472_013374 [Pythium oligandrum]